MIANKLAKALRALLNACYAADTEGELGPQVDGSLLDAALAALAEHDAQPAAEPAPKLTPELEAAFQRGFLCELHKNPKKRTTTAEIAGLREMWKVAGEDSEAQPAPAAEPPSGTSTNKRNNHEKDHP